jgi:hypothetical protein
MSGLSGMSGVSGVSGMKGMNGINVMSGVSHIRLNMPRHRVKKLTGLSTRNMLRY